MNTAQKIIKYLAIAFAFFLIFNIVSAILFGVYSLASILGLKGNNFNKQENINGEIMEINEFKDMPFNKNQIVNDNNDSNVINNIANLDIELAFSKLIIKSGEVFKIESNSKYVTCTQDNNNVIIRENGSNWFKKSEVGAVTLYIPNEVFFENIKIETETGEVDIESLRTKKLSFEFGVGSATINNLVVLSKAEIDGGVGKLSILDSKINNLDLEMGIGKCEIMGTFTGDNKFSSGIGRLEVNLNDDFNNYGFTINKGIGSISIDNQKMSDGMKYGDGNTVIRLDGGIGSIEIK